MEKLTALYENTIKRFSKVMMEKLEKNKHKKHWESVHNISFWRDKLYEEYAETTQILNTQISGIADLPLRDKKRLINECADLANIAMMIADNTGKLEEL